jgi:hypothetical protein
MNDLLQHLNEAGKFEDAFEPVLDDDFEKKATTYIVRDIIEFSRGRFNEDDASHIIHVFKQIGIHAEGKSMDMLAQLVKKWSDEYEELSKDAGALETSY